jgi:AAA domain
MFPVVHPEVLSNDWLCPTPFARERELREVVRRLDPPRPVAPPPWMVAVAGPSGAGTSTVARRAAREVVERLRAGLGGETPRLLHVRLPGLKGPHGVATALLRLLDSGFDGRGFPAAEILAGVLRRLRRDRRPFVVVLDDVAVGGPELAPLLRALVDPDRFLPEGDHGLPPWWAVLAGTPEGLATPARAVAGELPLHPFVTVAPYPPPALEAIVRDRAERALGRPAPGALVGSVVARSVEDGGGARRAIDLLRRELLGGARGLAHGFLPRDGELAISIEPWVVDAIGRASQGTSVEVGALREVEAELARAEGYAPLPPTTLWRRIVRLEHAGYVRREIRTGGSGGSRSLVRVLTPIADWVTVPAVPQTRRGFGGPAASFARPGAGSGRTAGPSAATAG